jgi:hypothetical protein
MSWVLHDAKQWVKTNMQPRVHVGPSLSPEECMDLADLQGKYLLMTICTLIEHVEALEKKVLK